MTLRLVIHQFKCHSNVTFEFNQALVCGASGAGKTTLLEAARFALTGGAPAADDSQAEFSVELIGPGFHLRRPGADDAVDQEWVDDFFRFYENRAARDIVFPPGRPTPRELCERCNDEIRSLESQLDHLQGGIAVLERDVGGAGEEEAAKCRDAREFLYLKHKQFLYTSYVQKVDLYQRELESLQREAVAGAPELPCSLEALQRHVCAERELPHWREYLQFSVEECKEMVEEYSEDVERARNPYQSEVHAALQQQYDEMCLALLSCPSCETKLAVRNNQLFIASQACAVAPAKQVAECKQQLDAYSRRATHALPQPEESVEYLEQQRQKWVEYQRAAEIVERWRGAFLPNIDGDAADLLRRAQRAEFVQERISFLIESIARLHREATKINLVDYSSALAVDVDRYLELKKMRASAAKLKRRIEAARRLRSMIETTAEQYTTLWLEEVEARLNALCAQVLDDFTVRLQAEGQAEIRCKGRRMTPESLSSGELARYKLCYTLAVAQQCGTKLLLLDEVLVHLDATSRARTIAMLEAETRGMWLLLVSHAADVPFLKEIIRL